jgi:hypothetical protein
MNTQSEIRQFGMVIRSIFRHGTRYIEAIVATRKSDRHAPYGCTDWRWEWPKHLAELEFDGLGIYGFVSDMRNDDGLCSYIGDNVEYRDVYSIDGGKAARMAKTLKRVGARLSKDRAYEPGDRLFTLCKMFKFDFVVEDRDPNLRDSDRRWVYHDLGEGRNRFRALIEQARQEVTVAQFGKAPAKAEA